MSETKKRAPKVGREYATDASEKRTERIQMRLRRDERELFDRAAELSADLDASSWARRILVREAKKIIAAAGASK